MAFLEAWAGSRPEGSLPGCVWSSKTGWDGALVTEPEFLHRDSHATPAPRRGDCFGFRLLDSGSKGACQLPWGSICCDLPPGRKPQASSDVPQAQALCCSEGPAWACSADHGFWLGLEALPSRGLGSSTQTHPGSAESLTFIILLLPPTLGF